MKLVVNGTLVDYKVLGQGPVIIWLHGWGSSSAAFAEIIKKIPNFQHILVDLPGFGGSQIPALAWSLQDYASFIKDFLKKLDLKKMPTAVVGHSFGASVAIVALAENQIKSQRLILLGAAGVRNTETQNIHRTVFKYLAKIGSVLTSPLPFGIRSKLRKRLYLAAGSDMLIHEDMSDTFKKSTTQDVVSVAKRIRQPTLLIYGVDDTDTPPRYGEIFKQNIKNSEIHFVKQAGHFVFNDQLEIVSALLNDFLKP